MWSDLRKAEHFQKNREYSVPSGIQQNSGHASARHSGSNTFENYQTRITQNVKNTNSGEC